MSMYVCHRYLYVCIQRQMDTDVAAIIFNIYIYIYLSIYRARYGLSVNLLSIYLFCQSNCICMNIYNMQIPPILHIFPCQKSFCNSIRGMWYWRRKRRPQLYIKALFGSPPSEQSVLNSEPDNLPACTCHTALCRSWWGYDMSGIVWKDI